MLLIVHMPCVCDIHVIDMDAMYAAALVYAGSQLSREGPCVSCLRCQLAKAWLGYSLCTECITLQQCMLVVLLSYALTDLPRF
jgi:hypothetical protein